MLFRKDEELRAEQLNQLVDKAEARLNELHMNAYSGPDGHANISGGNNVASLESDFFPVVVLAKNWTPTLLVPDPDENPDWRYLLCQQLETFGNWDETNVLGPETWAVVGREEYERTWVEHPHEVRERVAWRLKTTFEVGEILIEWAIIHPFSHYFTF